MNNIEKKAIKTAIRNQMKKQFPGWSKLTRKSKKALCRKVMSEVKSRYLAGELPTFEYEELLHIQAIPQGVMNLADMKELRESISNSIVPFMDTRETSILTPEMKLINNFLNDTILNILLAPEDRKYTPSKRLKTPAMFFRAELLKALYRPGLSYRLYCQEEINDPERKKNRTFIGLPLNRKIEIDHTELCQFRLSLSWKQQLNLLVYVLSHFYDSDLSGDHVIYGADGSDLAAKITTHPLATITVMINGKKEKISVYNQLDVDCGERRNKSDKSKFYVGYKMHTLCAINPGTGMAYPLFSLLAPANHHDKNFLAPLLAFAKAIGIDIKLVVCDEGYDGADRALMKKNNLSIITPPRKRVTIPENVEVSSGKVSVLCHEHCEVPMEYLGREEDNHEYRCGSVNGDCPFELNCPKTRLIALDNGQFGALPKTEEISTQLDNLRKVIERPFNYLKHRNGIDRITVKSHHATQVVETIATIAVLLIELSGQRKEEKKQNNQLEFDLAC